MSMLVVQDGSNGPDCLPHIRSDSIFELNFTGSNFDVVLVAENLPNLRIIVLVNPENTTLDVSFCLQRLKHLEELRILCDCSLLFALTNNDGKTYPKMKKFSIGTCDGIRNDPEEVVKLLDMMPNLEELDLCLSFDIGLEKPEDVEKEMLRIVEILTQVNSKVKSFHFLLAVIGRDNKLLTEGLQRFLKGLTAEVVHRGLLYQN